MHLHLVHYELFGVKLLNIYVCAITLLTIFISITQKAHRTYKRVLEGVNVGILWSYVVEETGVPGGNHRPWAGDHYQDAGNRYRAATVASKNVTPALSRPFLNPSLPSGISHPYQLDESISNSMGAWCSFFIFTRKGSQK